FFNLFLRSKLFQRVFARVVGIVDTPLLAQRSLGKLLRERQVPKLTAGAHKIILLQDAFTTFYEPELVVTVRDLLVKLGCEVEIAPFIPNGKALHVKGFLRR